MRVSNAMQITYRTSRILLLLPACWSVSAADEGFDRVLAPAVSSSVRKSEAAIVALQDGRLLLAYTEFYTVSPKDDAPARIVGRHSSGSGRTWSKPFVMVENTAKRNVMSVSLLRLKSGELAMTY